MIPDRYLYHLRAATRAAVVERGRIEAPSLAAEGFIHASFAADVAGTHALHFGGSLLARGCPDVEILRIDPRRLDVPVRVDPTPRGPMPHILGAIPRDAVVGVHRPGEPLPDRVQDARFCFVAFRGMTLLDLVGALDPISRVASMGFAPGTTCEIVSADRDAAGWETAWSLGGASFTVARARPPLDAFDVLVIAGGPGTRALVDDPSFVSWLSTFPENRLVATVCTGALLLGATRRLAGKRAITHASAHDALAAQGAIVTRERVVDEGQIVTSGGVTSGIDLGLHVVRRLHGGEVARAIAARMEWISA